MSGYHSILGTELNLDVSVPNGTYPAVVSGYVTEFKVGDRLIYGKGNIGVRGINIRDTVTVHDGHAKSNAIGEIELTTSKPKEWCGRK